MALITCHNQRGPTTTCRRTQSRRSSASSLKQQIRRRRPCTRALIAGLRVAKEETKVQSAEQVGLSSAPSWRVGVRFMQAQQSRPSGPTESAHCPVREETADNCIQHQQHSWLSKPGCTLGAVTGMMALCCSQITSSITRQGPSEFVSLSCKIHHVHPEQDEPRIAETSGRGKVFDSIGVTRPSLADQGAAQKSSVQCHERSIWSMKHSLFLPVRFGQRPGPFWRAVQQFALCWQWQVPRNLADTQNRAIPSPPPPTETGAHWPRPATCGSESKDQNHFHAAYQCEQQS